MQPTVRSFRNLDWLMNQSCFGEVQVALKCRF